MGKEAKYFTVGELIETLTSLPAHARVEIVDADTGWVMPLSRVDLECYTGENSSLAFGYPDNLVPGSVLLEARYQDYFDREYNGSHALSAAKVALIKESRDVQRTLEGLVSDWVLDNQDSVREKDLAALATFEKQLQDALVSPELKAEYVDRGVTLHLKGTRYALNQPIGARLVTSKTLKTGKEPTE